MINGRTKGLSFERDVANLFKKYFPKARRGYQYRDGADAPDVEGTDFHVECKRGKKVNIRAAMKQAVEATSRGTKKPPIVVSKEDREEIMVTLHLSLFFDILDELYCVPVEEKDKQ